MDFTLKTFIRANTRHKALVAFLCLFFTIFIGIEAQDEDDFFIYLSGSRDLFRGLNMYTVNYNEWYHYLYSVFFGIFIYPLTLLPYYLSKILWLSANVYFLYRCFVLLFAYLPLQMLTRRDLNLLVFCSVLFCMRFINDNFHCGQITIFLLWLSLQGIAFINTGQNLKGAMLIALGINIKIMPLVLLPYLLYRRKFRAAAAIMAFVVLLIFLPSLIIGHERNMELLSTWWSMMNPSKTEHVVDVQDRSFHGLSTFFSVFLHNVQPDPYGFGTRINIMDLSVERLAAVINTARACLVAITLYFLRTVPFRNAKDQYHQLWEIGYILAIIPLIFPHQHHYAFLFFLPACVYMVHYFIMHKNELSPRRRRFLRYSLIAVFLAFNLQLLLGEFRPFYEHFKIITFGALYFISVLALCSPTGDRLILHEVTDKSETRN
jgi:hypothetical protein